MSNVPGRQLSISRSCIASPMMQPFTHYFFPGHVINNFSSVQFSMASSFWFSGLVPCISIPHMAVPL